MRKTDDFLPGTAFAEISDRRDGLANFLTHLALDRAKHTQQNRDNALFTAHSRAVLQRVIDAHGLHSGLIAQSGGHIHARGELFAFHLSGFAHGEFAEVGAVRCHLDALSGEVGEAVDAARMFRGSGEHGIHEHVEGGVIAGGVEGRFQV